MNKDFNVEFVEDNVVIDIDGFVKYIKKYSSKSFINITRNIVRVIMNNVLKIYVYLKYTFSCLFNRINRHKHIWDTLKQCLNDTLMRNIPFSIYI